MGVVVTETRKNKDGKEIQVKVESSRMNQILDAINRHGYFQVLMRYISNEYDMEESMFIIESIGKQYTPNFVIDDENRFLYENFIKWCHSDASMVCHDPTNKIIPGRLKRGIYIGGTTGTGKTLCMKIMNAYCHLMGIMVKLPYTDNVQQLVWSDKRADEIWDTYQKTGNISQFKEAALLCIQDLGSESPDMPMYMGSKMDALRHIMEYRGDKSSEQLTFITSNYPINGEFIEKRYGDRVTSRLQEMCNYFVLKGKDRREV